MNRSNLIQVGEKTKKVISFKEKFVDLPTLSWLYEKIGEDLYNVFPTERLFISYIEMMVSSSENMHGFMHRVFESAYDNNDLDEIETDLFENTPLEFYCEAITNNFKEFSK